MTITLKGDDDMAKSNKSMQKLFVVYETQTDNGQLLAIADKISENDSLFWWLKDHQAINCFWYPKWEDALEAAERWNESYRIIQNNK